MIARLLQILLPLDPNVLRNGQMAAAHAVIEAASITRLSDDDAGYRLAVHCHELGNPMWRSDCGEEIAKRIARAWPALNDSDAARLISHLAARVQVAVERPSRDRARMRDASSKRGSNWVNGWRVDAHDLEAMR